MLVNESEERRRNPFAAVERLTIQLLKPQRPVELRKSWTPMSMWCLEDTSSLFSSTMSRRVLKRVLHDENNLQRPVHMVPDQEKAGTFESLCWKPLRRCSRLLSRSQGASDFNLSRNEKRTRTKGWINSCTASGGLSRREYWVLMEAGDMLVYQINGRMSKKKWINGRLLCFGSLCVWIRCEPMVKR